LASLRAEATLAGAKAAAVATIASAIPTVSSFHHHLDLYVHLKSQELNMDSIVA
jgi:hypothetical protein